VNGGPSFGLRSQDTCHNENGARHLIKGKKKTPVEVVVVVVVVHVVVVVVVHDVHPLDTKCGAGKKSHLVTTKPSPPVNPDS
jgi:hypothetical protein